MSVLASVRVAIGALHVHKGRSFLTSLGIVIGIGAVIALVSAGDGVESKLEESIANVGSNLILVRPGAHTSTGDVTEAAPLTRDDATALRRQLGALLPAVAEVQMTQRLTTTATTQWPTLLCGTTTDIQPLREWKLASGRFFTAEELAESAPVCVLGDTVRRKLFPNGGQPVGQSIRVEHTRLHVVGVLAPKGRNPIGADQDDELFLPITTLQRKLVGEDKVSIILTTTRAESQTSGAMAEITRVLRQSRRVKPGSEDFDVSSVREMAEVGYLVTHTLQVLVAVIAGISLIVGGIGIMNIMLASVTERTREIGIRMAIGATAAQVLTQFLFEALILSLTGGLTGIALGIGASVLLAHLAGWPVVVSPLAVMFAVAVAAAVGLFFGLYPAWKASRLDPIRALRAE
jgi:putative ABC transport system permease protein